MTVSARIGADGGAHKKKRQRVKATVAQTRSHVESSAADVGSSLDLRCMLATRLLDAVGVDAQLEHVVSRRRDTRGAFRGKHVAETQRAMETLVRVRAWTQCLVDVQYCWVECSARVERGAAVRLWDRLDALLRDAIACSTPEQQFQLLKKDLPRCLKRATALARTAAVPTTGLISTGRLSGIGQSRNDSNHVTTAIAAAATRSTAVSMAPEERILLTHQWVPCVLQRIYDSVEHQTRIGRSSTALRDILRNLWAAIRDENPYSFLQVLYRAPPPSTTSRALKDTKLPGSSEDTHTEVVAWRLEKTTHAVVLIKLLNPLIDELCEIAEWMVDRSLNSTQFWQPFERVMVLTRQLGLTFHHVMLALYAMAMQRYDMTKSPTSGRDEVKQLVSRNSAQQGSKQAEFQRYGLASLHTVMKSSPQIPESIIRETYQFFPEVLVFVDQWRWEHPVYEHGFHEHGERASDYEVGFNTWRSPRCCWQRIACMLLGISRRWKLSTLREWTKPLPEGVVSERTPQDISIGLLGELERDMKSRFSDLIDLFYRQNLAKWASQRHQTQRVRFLQEVTIMKRATPLKKKRKLHTTDKSCSGRRGSTDANYQEFHGVSRWRDGFRRPSTLHRIPITGHPNSSSDRLRPTLSLFALAATADDLCTQHEEAAIFEWTDSDIDTHEQDKERVYELQSDVLARRAKMILPELLLPPSSVPPGSGVEVDGSTMEIPTSRAVSDEFDPLDVMDGTCSARALLRGWRALVGVVQRVVQEGEAIALHGAAEALIQRPSLRVTKCGANEQADGELEAKLKLESADHDADLKKNLELQAIVREAAAKFEGFQAGEYEYEYKPDIDADRDSAELWRDQGSTLKDMATVAQQVLCLVLEHASQQDRKNCQDDVVSRSFAADDSK